jgi:hypothetical protein
VDFKDAIGLGVAGNFAGHLEQAGEASDFVHVAVKDAKAPKGLFPFYVPGASDHFLGVYPVSSDRLALAGPGESLQIEPEVALLCEIEAADDAVVAVHPKAFAAHDDCSIRREGASKISQKKNWGPASKGTSGHWIEIDTIGAGGVLDGYRIASFLVRDGEAHAYGQDSAVASYSYFHEQLMEWIAAKLNEQRDEGPLEDVGEWWRKAGRPPRALISIGATRYTDFGESTYLEAGDRAVVVVYDANRFDAASLRERVQQGTLASGEGCSVLDQVVVEAGGAS